MDSNKLPDNWEDIISKSNPDSHYRWKKLDDNLRAHEDDIEKKHEKASICDAPAKKKMKGTNNLLSCEFCDVTFYSKDNLKRHE